MPTGLTKAEVLEFHRGFRIRNEPWSVAVDWVTGRIGTAVRPSEQALHQQWTQLHKQFLLTGKSRKKGARQDLLDAPYHLPSVRKQKYTEHVQKSEVEAVEGTPKPCRAVLSDLTVNQRTSPSDTHDRELTCKIRQQNFRIYTQEKDLKATRRKNEKLKERVASYTPHNVQRKLNRREGQIIQLEQENESVMRKTSALESKVSCLVGKVDSLKSNKKRLQSGLKYYKATRDELSDTCDSREQELLSQVDKISRDNI